RLHVLALSLPPLRERSGDLALLARHILAREGIGRRIAPEACAALEEHTWPGNVRELRNVLLQAVERAAAGDITPATLASLIPLRSAEAPPRAALLSLKRAEMDAILRALRDSAGNVSRAASALHVHRVTLHRKMERYGSRVSRRARKSGVEG